MVLPFDQIPSEVKIPWVVPDPTSIEDKLRTIKALVEKRLTKCDDLHFPKKRKKKALAYTYKMYCVCPRYCPNYSCKHSGNVIIDRDVLTKEEHICYLAMPKENHAAPRKPPRYIHKKVVLPNCTARIAQLAQPDLKRVRCTIEDYKHILNPKTQAALKSLLTKKPNEVVHTSINNALNFIEEERRLQQVAKSLKKRRCRRYKRNILCKQRCLIKTITCVIFEEMKDFLLNDQFLIDESSTLGAVIFEHLRSFTDNEFHSTTNLREYQQILANNLTIWINKFLFNLNIHLPPEEECKPDSEAFLPVKDYISSSDSQDEDREYSSDDDFYEYVNEENQENTTPLPN